MTSYLPRGVGLSEENKEDWQLWRLRPEMKIRADWQLNRVRAALRVIRTYDRDSDGKPYGWRDLWAIIASDWEDEAGIKLPYTDKHGGERLRQFVEGVTDRNDADKRKFPAPKDEMLEAIVAYLISSDTLTEEELKEYALSSQAPLRLAEYLYSGSSAEPAVSEDFFDGTFVSVDGLQVSDERFVSTVRSLTLQPPADQGIMRVVERVGHYETMQQPEIGREAGGTLLSEEAYDGWAVATPENTLLMFLKNANDQGNRYYFTDGRPHRTEFEGIADIRLRLQNLSGSLFRPGGDVPRVKDIAAILPEYRKETPGGQ